MFDINDAQILGTDIGNLLLQCIQKSHFRALVLVSDQREVVEFIHAIRKHTYDNPRDMLSTKIKRICGTPRYFVRFTNGSSITVASYRDPYNDKVHWRGRRFHYIINMSTCAFDRNVENILHEITMQYNRPKDPDNYFARDPIDEPLPEDDTYIYGSDVLDDFLSGFCIHSDREES